MKIINRILKWLFWNRVYKCNHEWDGDVCNLITCATPLCSGTETRCKKCGVCSYVMHKGEVCVGLNQDDTKHYCCKCFVEYYEAMQYLLEIRIARDLLEGGKKIEEDEYNMGENKRLVIKYDGKIIFNSVVEKINVEELRDILYAEVGGIRDCYPSSKTKLIVTAEYLTKVKK